MNPVVIVTSGSGVNGLAIVRSLGRLGIETHVVVHDVAASLAAVSRFCSRVHVLAEETPEALLAVLIQIAGELPVKSVLYCDSDETLQMAAPSAAELEGRFLLTSPLRRIPELQDKSYQAAQAAAAGIAVPRSWYPNDWDELQAIQAGPGRMLIVKPNPAAFQKRRPFKVFRVADSRAIAEELKQYDVGPRGMIVQEFIEGADENCWAVLGYRSEKPVPVQVLTVTKVKQSGSGAGGVIVVGHTVENPELGRLATRFVEQLGYIGLFAIEFKYSQATREYFFIEGNFRSFRSHVIGRRSGLPLPRIAYADLTGRADLATASPRRLRSVWFYDLNLFVLTLKVTRDRGAAARMIGHILLAPFRRREGAVWSADDLRPVASAARQSFQDIAQRLARKLRGRSTRRSAD